ncbi:MAG: VWA domain-containing protein [Candidatus Limnocylindrales bacterium]
MPDLSARKRRERGQILVLFVLVLVAVMGAAALVIDVGILRTTNARLQNAFDAGALAGSALLPDDPNGASALAYQFALRNYPDLTPADVTVTFRCVIGGLSGAPRASDVQAGVCNPGLNHAFTCNVTGCQNAGSPPVNWEADCVPAEGNKCNTIVLTGKVNVAYHFGPAVGVDSGSTQLVTAVGCTGLCGQKPTNPIDLVIIVDRSGSMSGVDATNARTATDSVRKSYDPAEQWIGLSLLGPSQTTAGCQSWHSNANPGTAAFPADLRRWVPIGLSGDSPAPNVDAYTTDPLSPLAHAIACFDVNGSTDLSDPIYAAIFELTNYGRANATKGIIMMTDGQPNQSVAAPVGNNYCAEASQAATTAKNAGIEFFTIGFGLDGGNNATCDDSTGAWHGLQARTLLASMATQPSVDGGCEGTSNTDGDHFFCVPKTAGISGNLTTQFQRAASALAGGTKLIKLP